MRATLRLALPSLALAASANAAALSFNLGAEAAVDAAIDVLDSFYPHSEAYELDHAPSPSHVGSTYGEDVVVSSKRDEYLEVQQGTFHAESGVYGKKCILKPVEEGKGEFDDDNFKRAVGECGKGGIISLPAANYTINSPLTIHLQDSLLSVPGFISFSSNISHWVDNRVHFDFQNLALGWIIEGSNYVLDGHGSGGIYGNGQEWYNWAKEEGNKYGRPMSLAIANSTNVTVQNWSVVQPQFWAGIVIKSENVLYKNYYVNATNFNEEGKDALFSWVQNTDGCDTYASNNVTFDGMIYQGGDDCLAFKPNSSSITARNVTCYGGTGIAFGSIAQYKDQPDYLTDIHLEDITLRPSSQHLQHNGLYFKSWIGYEIGHPPNGGGGGVGRTRNITAKNVDMQDNHRPIFIQTNLVYLSSHQNEGMDTGKFEWADIHFTNITGTSLNNRIVWLDCSSTQPCHNITFDGLNVRPGKTDDDELHYVCNNVVLGGKDGLNQCHPSNSTKEGWQTGGEDR